MKKTYTFMSLVDDPEFQKWILDPTPEGSEKWESIYRGDLNCKPIFDDARHFILGIDARSVSLSEPQKLRGWEKIKNEAGIKPLHKILPLNGSIKVRSKNMKWKYWLVAASLALVLLCVAMVELATLDKVNVTGESVEIIKSTGSGQKSKIHLPDGSVVFLNSESSIIYDDQFSGIHRSVELEGEAFFDVVKDPSKPFIVNAKGILTTALGTSFNINATGETSVSVVLISGKVKVVDSYSNDEKILTEREKIRFLKGRGFEPVQAIKNLNDILWKEGIIVFEDTPMLRVIEVLEKWYGVNIEVKGDISNLTYSGRYDNEYLSNLLKSMAFGLDIHYQIDGNNVKLNFEENMKH